MIRNILTVLFCFLSCSTALAQSDEPSKFEVAPEFVVANRDSISSNAALGFGGRFTFNFNRYFALETAGYFFPENCFQCIERGRAVQAVGGAKVGKRFKSWGAFVKARPGVVSYSDGEVNVEPTNATGLFPFQFTFNRVTSFATDVGGVVEFYPSKRIVTRFDVGDTMVFFRRRLVNAIQFDPGSGTSFLLPVPRPGRTSHNLQFTTSVGFRF
jgi:hypothetical protein